MRPDVIKLDRALVEGLHDDPGELALLDSFTTFAQRTGTQVCAEGIESDKELDALIELESTWARAIYLARPGPPWPTINPDTAETMRRRAQARSAAGSPTAQAQRPRHPPDRVEMTKRTATLTAHHVHPVRRRRRAACGVGAVDGHAGRDPDGRRVRAHRSRHARRRRIQRTAGSAWPPGQGRPRRRSRSRRPGRPGWSPRPRRPGRAGKRFGGLR